ncbi:MAG: hypothetical protein AB1384_07265 [Actinomycetota bacterium]
MSGSIMKKKWFKWTVSVIVILSMLGLSVGVWYWIGKPKVNEEAQDKAQELFDLAREAGLLQEVEDEAAFVDDLAQVFGDDGGYAVEVVEGNLAEAVLSYDQARTGEVTQRPIIAEPEWIEFQLLVIKVYNPELYVDKVLPYIRDMDFQGELPAWLQEDLETL